jgi:hypothetical protein
VAVKSAEPSKGGPEQVVQRAEPARELATGEAATPRLTGAAGAAAQPKALASEELKASAARPAGITPRHLEAELNRLEDELKR